MCSYGDDADPSNPLAGQSNCAFRANASLRGSSSVLGGSTKLPSDCPPELCNGLLSHDRRSNPDFARWSKVFVNYCDGLSFTGDRDDPVPTGFGGQQIWLRGKRILRAVLAALAKDHGLANAKRIIVSGNSAGGLTVYLHLDQIAAMLKELAPQAAVYGFPDGGYFLDVANTEGVHTFREKMDGTFRLSNGSSGVDPACLAQHMATPTDCLFAQHMAPLLKTPFFGLEAQYDSWQIPNVLELTCDKSTSASCMSKFQSFRDSMYKLFQPVIDKAALVPPPGKLRNGVFFGACAVHCEATVDGGAIWSGDGTRNYTVPVGPTGRTVAMAFGDCYFGRSGGCSSVDVVRWPSNPSCK